MKNLLWVLTLLIASLLPINPSIADNDPKITANNGKYNFFDTSFFSLAKKNEDAFDAPSAVYVLSANDIRRSGATSIPEALKLVPGLQVAKINGNQWAISARGFNAQFSNKLLVMIDGRTVYSPLFSGTFWDIQEYVLADVEKIEVIRGSGGAVWGANAVNGVINIITKNAVDTQGGYASAIVGNQDQAIIEARYGGKTKSLNHYRVYAKQVNRGQMDKLNTNQGNDDGYKQSQAGFRYDIRSIKDNIIAIHGDVRSGKVDNYFNLSSLAADQTNKNSAGANLVASWTKTISEKSSFILQSYLDYNQLSTEVLNLAERVADIDLQYFYYLNNKNQITLGLGYRLIQDKISETPLINGVVPLHYSPNQRNDEILSGFLQDKITLTDALSLTIGSKFEVNNFTGSEVQPSAKLTFFPSRNQTIWASVSRAVRTPTRAEKSIQINNPGPKSAGLPLQAGSPRYTSENVVAYELGYRIKPTQKSLIDISTFYNDYSNLRTFQGNFPSIAVNNGNGESYGGEITGKWQVTNDLKLEAGYDFLMLKLKNRFPASESTLYPLYFAERQSPKNQFRLRVNYDISPKIEFDNIVYYVNSIQDSRSNSDLTGVKSYATIDTRLGYLFNNNLDFKVGIQNLLNNRHQEFDKGLFGNEAWVGRTVYFKTVVKF